MPIATVTIQLDYPQAVDHELITEMVSEYLDRLSLNCKDEDGWSGEPEVVHVGTEWSDEDD